ncbi:hypothetical protein L596_007359 [Steinernema carpocapsae]|uniref:Uncharacterized protein n=1 Tax=Steinernema carpocapsae TaxID=34508 RepID=A0A4U5P920_STECR|nr:hypothetical protein L596_007359 [Steinernema carpocapsae]
MGDAIQNRIARPLVAVLTSENVDSICARNRIPSFADLLAPFSVVSTSVSDPNSQSVKTKLRVELRDVQRHGFLLTLTALPHVLQESVASVRTNDSDSWTSAYQDSLFSWFESTNHEFLKTYLCSMFVVSAHEANPMGELTRLVQLQYAQQHGSNESSPSLGPRHCADPKWFMPNILKYYVLVFDVSIGGRDDSAAKELFASMCKTYSDKNCFFLKINSGDAGSNLPDPWSLFLESRYRGLEAGLASARKSLLLTKNDSVESPVSPLSVTSHHNSEPYLLTSPISTVSSSVRAHSPIFSTSQHGLSIPTLSSANLENGSMAIANPQALPSPLLEASLSNSQFEFGGIHGQFLNAEDRRRLMELMESFVNDALVPFAQKQMRYLSENLNGRRGFSKSIFSGMRKWVGSSSTGQLGAAPMTYSSESAEMQLRRLADLTFLFGLCSYAYPIYHSLKKDFAADQAWLYHAGASEMAAISKFLAEEQNLSFKDFPDHYLTTAMEYYMNTCGQSLLAVRCALLSCVVFQVLAAKEKNPELNRQIYKDASNFLIRLTSNQSDLESAILLERASDCFAKGDLHRKMSFHFILAGHRFLKAGLKDISLECYQRALPQIVDRSWRFAEVDTILWNLILSFQDHMLFTLANDSKNVEMSRRCAVSLIKPYSTQHPDQQMVFFKKMLQVLQGDSQALKEPFAVPLLNSSNIVTIHGDRPKRNANSFDTADWEDLQKLTCLFLKLSPMTTTARTNVRTDATDNRIPAATPPHERFRVRIPLKNPLDIPLKLKNLRLVTSEIQFRHEGDSTIEIEASRIDELTIEPQGEVAVELSLKPTANVSRMKISKLQFELTSDDLSVEGFLPLDVKGPRKATSSAVQYETDCRLDVLVSERKWPLLDTKLVHRSLDYCDQIASCQLTVTNIGEVDVDSFCLSTERPDLVTLTQTGADGTWKPVESTRCETSAGESPIYLSKLESIGLTMGATKQIKLMLRAPPQPVENFPLRLLFVYVGANGAFREHRECVMISTKAIVKTQAYVLDASSGVCCIDIQNLTSARDSMFAKIEVQRVSAVSRLASGAPDTHENFVYISPIRNRSLLIESDQRDRYCFTLTGSAPSPVMESSELWLADQMSTDVLPAWPDYAFKTAKFGRQTFQPSSESPGYLQLAVFWKALLVFSDGALSTVTIFGETPVRNPFFFADQKSFIFHRIPGTDHKVTIINERAEPDSSKPAPISLNDVSKSLVSSVHLQSSTITHNFSESRMCNLVVRLTVQNLNQAMRDIWVIVNCGPIDQSTAVPEPGGVASILQAVAVATVSSQQTLIPHQAVFRAPIPYGSSHSFVIRLRATSPSVYDLTSSIRVSAAFDADPGADRAPLSVPLTYVTILDSRASIGVRAAAALRV